MKIGIFGGTFDPVHIGHLVLAAEAADQLYLDQVLWVLTPNPPHKKNQQILQLSHRLKMLEFATDENIKFQISRVDIDREPPHYASDTVQILKNNSPSTDYYYLMGLDSLNDIAEWHNPDELINLVEGIVVMVRHDEDIRAKVVMKQYPQLNEKLILLTTPIIEISSTDIRKRVAEGKQYRYYLPENVYRYIVKNQLYKY